MKKKGRWRAKVPEQNDQDKGKEREKAKKRKIEKEGEREWKEKEKKVKRWRSKERKRERKAKTRVRKIVQKTHVQRRNLIKHSTTLSKKKHFIFKSVEIATQSKTFYYCLKPITI